MGTNYYLQPPVDWPGNPLHIGKSSFGWCFSVHVIPERGINSLQDWEVLIRKPGAVILDEYDRPVTADEMMAVITERAAHGQYGSDQGPLNRHEIGPYCLSWGPGPWDHCVGEFS